MALRKLGKDPESPSGGSPTVYLDDTKDNYLVQGWKVLDKEIDAAERWADWLGLVSATTGRGVQVRRARIVSEPVSDYIRFEYEVTDELNIAAGEKVRWLPRRRATDIALPGNDFWLFDESLVLVNHFDGEGDSLEHEVTADPEVAKLCASAFETVWERATPHEKYRLTPQTDPVVG
ncbi:DUF6879 family protein [Streptomyces scopuliridis]